MGNPTEEQAWIAVIRDPDFATQVEPIIGEVSYINVDLGGDFNGIPENREVAEEWARGLEAQAADAPEVVGEWVNSYINEMFVEWEFGPSTRVRDP